MYSGLLYGEIDHHMYYVRLSVKLPYKIHIAFSFDVSVISSAIPKGSLLSVKFVLPPRM